MSKFHWRKCYGHSLLDRMSFGLSKKTHYLNLIRYYSVSIENTYCYQLPSIMTQSIGNIWSTYDLSRRSKSLLTLVQTQYSFKVKSPYSIVVWWIMTNDSLASWFIVGSIQCASHTLVHSPWPRHVQWTNYSLYWITQIHEPTADNLSTCKESMTCIFYATPNAPKSCTM